MRVKFSSSPMVVLCVGALAKVRRSGSKER
jgi:hypothetical protein